MSFIEEVKKNQAYRRARRSTLAASMIMGISLTVLIGTLIGSYRAAIAVDVRIASTIVFAISLVASITCNSWLKRATAEAIKEEVLKSIKRMPTEP